MNLRNCRKMSTKWEELGWDSRVDTRALSRSVGEIRYLLTWLFLHVSISGWRLFVRCRSSTFPINNVLPEMAAVGVASRRAPGRSKIRSETGFHHRHVLQAERLCAKSEPAVPRLATSVVR